MAGVEEGEKQPLQPTVQPRDKWLHLASYGARVWGLVTIAVMWAATVTSLQGYYDVEKYAIYYLLAASVVLTFFEITWILDKIACCVRAGCCCICWYGVLWVENWRKFLLYACLSVPLFLQGFRFVFGVVSGFCLVILACLYLLKTFSKMATNKAQPPPQQPAVVKHEMAVQTEVGWVSEEQTRDPGPRTRQPLEPQDPTAGAGEHPHHQGETSLAEH